MSYVLVVTSEEQKDIIDQVKGLSGFYAALRVGVTCIDGKCEITFTDPTYLGMAYLGNEYGNYFEQITNLQSKLAGSMQGFDEVILEPFGSEKGLKEKNLKKYNYMVGMPKFDDTVELAQFFNFKDATDTIEANLNDENSVYIIKYPDLELALYGIALTGEEGEENFLPIIDIGEKKQTSFEYDGCFLFRWE